MDNVKLIFNNIGEVDAQGIFYVFNSKYYLMYTLSELDNDEYVKLYIVQVCKEIQKTASGPVDTGYMLGMEINSPNEWKKVQESVGKIVDDKKNNVQSKEIQYLPSNMLTKIKIISNNKFKLLKEVMEYNFGVKISSREESKSPVETTLQSNEPINKLSDQINNQSSDETKLIASETNNLNSFLNNSETSAPPSANMNNLLVENSNENGIINNKLDEVVVDYRTRFFEEQEKNEKLEEEIKLLTAKIESIKSILG